MCTKLGLSDFYHARSQTDIHVFNTTVPLATIIHCKFIFLFRVWEKIKEKVEAKLLNSPDVRLGDYVEIHLNVFFYLFK